ncbi:hypothetical protein PRUPE_6G088100 [Prunus persica]|uniref:CCT domain-containing protein n=1 Tax=Prunus persica TaxID=3760 RepID=A0A251NMB8_PRUPE|nr:uncharacterized protein LOC18774820 isoform X2 [Prunus persica]ONI00422.1 hypothetical protein PRUPE_6G088100 [Prunus persica]
MYGHNSTAFPRAADFQFQGSPPAHPLLYHEQLLVSAEFSNSCSSGSSSYCASPISSGTGGGATLIQRSVSSHSLQKTSCGTHRLVSDLLESETGPVRRVYSTGDLDLQLINNMNNGMPQQLQYCGYNRSSSETSPLSSESSMIIEGMSKACPYNPEEKKERIERYRNKRNLRNFNKTIKVVITDVQPSIVLLFGRLFEIVNFPKRECMLAGRRWRTAGHASEDDLQGMMKLRRTLLFSGVT